LYRLIKPPPFDWIEEQGTYQACKFNELVSLEKRHLIDLGEPELDIWKDCNRIMSELMAKLPVLRVATAKEVVDHKNSPSSKRRYEEAFAQNESEGFPANIDRVSAFIKLEKWKLDSIFSWEDVEELFGEYATAYKPPRMIQYRSFRYCAELSRYLLPIEEALWSYREDNGLCPFAKKMNSFAIAETVVAMAALFDDPIFVLADHKKFDSCVTTPWIALEHNGYMQANPSDELDLLMEMQYENVSYTKTGTKYTCTARKMSGEYNTSLGDTTINYSILSHVFGGVTHAKLLNGDDSVIALEKSDLEKVDLSPEKWKSLGFKTTWSTTDLIEEVEFCQSRPVQVREGVWRMVRLPARAISRSVVSVKRYEGTAWYGLAAAIGQSELACGDGVPMIQAFAQMMIRASLGIAPVKSEMTHRSKLEGISKPEAREVTPLARLSFELAFGICEADQLEFETWCDASVPDILPATLPDDRVPEP
jgi:hypothetical protein